jgi:hypothetical protein
VAACRSLGDLANLGSSVLKQMVRKVVAVAPQHRSQEEAATAEQQPVPSWQEIFGVE